ncbi:MAG: PEP/pyruvate-binding domain-containing protein, partial [Kiritimatiellae bacterium]|nr:PEP/pyruvate-binding domain-containing protein [Kiritimatiellia bacterium]
PVLAPDSGFEIVELDPGPGFDPFSAEVHRIIEEHGLGTYYVFDNLSALVAEWATDELLANFFQVTCPFLFELDTVTYFALTRGKHAHGAVARIRDTTQLLIDVYHVKDQLYIHPLKVWDRYSPQMFLPHLVEGEAWSPVFQSGDAAALSSVASQSPLRPGADTIAPWESVYRRLTTWRQTGAPFAETMPEVTALRQELARMMIGSHPEFNRLVDRYFTVDDLLNVRSRLIGSGRVGGKAAGMLVARRVLAEDHGGVDFGRVLESHDSFYIGSDVFFTFLVNNDLFRLRLQLSRSSQISHNEFEEVERRFLAGRFPPEILEQFRNMLDYFGQAPIIVRSSSLLEDSYGNAFAGKYRSEFCANQGSPDQRLEAFLQAVRLVYASALNPDALSYRRRRGLGESDEQMAILVMRVSGMPYRRYFFPSLAGVAFSRNLYAWSDRIDPKQGVIRLVFGLGTRAVNRVGGDYPRMIAVSQPTLRPEVGAKIAKYSQREMDLLDLPANALVTLPISDVLGRDYPNVHLLVSVMKDGHLYDPFSREVGGDGRALIPTFNNLVGRTDFVKIMGRMLEALEQAYGRPVDTEFTAHVDERGQVRVNVLQCRPLWVPGATGRVAIPESIPPARLLFKSDRFISGGDIGGVKYLIFIDPRWYAAITDLDLKKSLGRLVGRLNNLPDMAEGKVIMIGPGRWGSGNIDLGVNVGYADIDNASVLVELAREEAGHIPEVSYGTHFFQDLVEQQIIYLPVYPDDPDAAFNGSFFEKSPNALLRLLPDAGKYEGVVKVIEVPAAAGGAHARVIADPETRRAVCFLE